MKKRVILLGSSGSIGCNAIEILRNFRDDFQLVGLSVNKNISALNKHLEDFDPEAIAVGSEESFSSIKPDFINGASLYSGGDGICSMIRDLDADLVVNSIVGAAGLLPTLESIKTGKNVALANKESLVVAGELVGHELRKYGVDLIPIDSEHSAIWQCLTGEKRENVKRIILTASGGPFFNRDSDSLGSITVEEALDHPNWEMGNKITIDSATLMNKGFEVIETKWLFDIAAEQIDVVIHPQSIVHSMVEFIDGSIKAQMGVPDMKLPIQYAMTYPDRRPGVLQNGSLFDSRTLTFEPPNREKFPCLDLAFRSMKEGGTSSAVLNASNEIAVQAFLDKKIKFTQISELIEEALNSVDNRNNPGLEDYLQADLAARDITDKRIRQYG